MRKLFLFTNEFPYGTWEPYLETEVKYYNRFDKVYIIALQLRKEHAKTIRTLPDNVKVVPVYYAPKFIYLINSIRVLFNVDLYRELKELYKSNRLGVSQIVSCFVYLSRADYEARKIKDLIPKAEFKDSLFYSYRFEYQPYVAILLKRWLILNNKIVSRAHRYDLYEDRRKNGYIPLRKILLENINWVLPCSLDGVTYLNNCYPVYADKITAAFLGTMDKGVEEYYSSDKFRIVSCSNVVEVKRLDLLIEALANIQKHQIKWTHFGDGVLMEKIKKLAANLPANIEVDFRGNVANSTLMDDYKNNCYDLFVNLSSSEGIPVSIMEAMSFGIPCLATNAGGTGEIVEDGVCGTIIPVDISANKVAENIVKYININKEKYLQFRNNARVQWLEKFDSYRNYRVFIEKLINVCDMRNEE